MSRRQIDPHRALARSILERLAPAQAIIERDHQTPWASATFAGARHHFDLIITGDNAIKLAAQFGATISAEEVTIAGHIVADIVLVRQRVVCTGSAPIVSLGVEALTVAGC